MKTYLTTIRISQQLFLGISIAIMLVLPLLIVFLPEGLSDAATLRLYDLSHLAVFFVMVIRPLADLFRGTTLIRPLVILRKGVGVLSASIVISFIFAKLIIDPGAYAASLLTARYWSLENFALFAHLADLSAILLIVTSNTLSKKLLGAWWKRIQRLSYVYFYASSLYVFMVFENNWVLISMLVVTVLTMAAFIKKRI